MTTIDWTGLDRTGLDRTGLVIGPQAMTSDTWIDAALDKGPPT